MKNAKQSEKKPVTPAAVTLEKLQERLNKDDLAEGELSSITGGGAGCGGNPANAGK